MVLFVTNSKDYSVNKIIRFCLSKKSDFDFIRINDDIDSLKFRTKFDGELQETVICLRSKEINLRDIKYLFYRRGILSNDINFSKLELKYQDLSNFSRREFDECLHCIYNNLLKTIDHFSSAKECQSSNKLVQLQEAVKVGFRVPKSLITTKKSDLLKFMKGNSGTIIKPVYNHKVLHLTNEREVLEPNGTHLIDNKFFSTLYDNFALTLFQEYIEKKFEIRVFFAMGKLYSMAIISQKDTKTKIDYRSYNELNENRCVPYKLPSRINEQIERMINSLNLTTGSIDLIYSSNNDYFFLEINSSGQFSFLSEVCNYNIENDIANTLLNYG